MSHKSIVNTLLTGAFLLAGTATFAQNSKASAQLVAGIYLTKQEGKICLAVEKQPNTFAFVQLLTPTGEELYRATLPQKGDKFRQLLDLRELESGTYTIRIKQGGTVIVKSLQVQSTAPDTTATTRHLTLGN